MKIKTKKTFTTIKIHWDVYWPGYWYVGSEHNKEFGISLGLIEIHVHHSYLDWMIKEEKEKLVLEDGRVFETWIRNPKYENEEIKMKWLP